jgi:hypothetical protein
MLRAVLLGVLTVSTLSACKKSDTDPVAAKSQPGVAAGKVLEVKGTVSLKHGDATRALAAGDPVEGDDVVITGADGNVVIELAHNSARWELGPNKQQKVNESIAWKAQKATAEEVEQATAAAGRPAERNAAGTVATADEAPGAPAPPPPPAAQAAPAAEPAAEAPTPPPAPARRRVAPPARAAAIEEPKADVADDAPVERHTRAPVMKKESAELAPAAAAAPSGVAATAPSAPVLVDSKLSAIKACFTNAGAKDTTTLTITVAGGKASVAFSTPPAAGIKTCVDGVVAGIHFTGSDKVTRTIKP